MISSRERDGQTLGSNGAASSSFRASMSSVPRSYAALASSRVTVVR